MALQIFWSNIFMNIDRFLLEMCYICSFITSFLATFATLSAFFVLFGFFLTIDTRVTDTGVFSRDILYPRLFYLRLFQL